MTNRRLLLTARGSRSQRLDPATRERGKAGVAAARAELQRALAEVTDRDAA
jgi:hypothetical protein